MKTPLTPLVLLVTLATVPLLSHAEAPAQSERIAASFVLTLGRAPTPAEVSSAEKLGSVPVSELVARQRQRLESDPALKQATAMKAWRDAFGREPSLTEAAGMSSGNQTYTEQVKSHIKYLAGHPEEYERVMERAYRLVIRRGVYAEEIAYWKKRDTLSYVLLVGCVEDWGRRNAPGLMVTTGTPTVSVNSNYLTAFRLSPAVAAEARIAADLSGDGTADFMSATGRNLVAAGAGNIVTGGRIAFVASGGSNILPEAALN